MSAEEKPQGQAEQERLNRAYARVFGEEGKRTQDQQAVWDELCQIGFERAPLSQVSPSGMIDPLALARNDGKRLVYLHISERIRRALTPSEPSKVTVKKD